MNANERKSGRADPSAGLPKLGSPAERMQPITQEIGRLCGCGGAGVNANDKKRIDNGST